MKPLNQLVFAHVSDVASWAIQIIEQLLNQPTIQNEHGLIIEILNEAAQEYLTEDITVRAVEMGI